MSTEHQRYSTQNQADALAKYAEEHGMTIVRTFADDGKSGLSLAGRAGLLHLLSEVQKEQHLRSIRDELWYQEGGR
jgi:DNA invertase Pin-like site-specific DNA recombinase